MEQEREYFPDRSFLLQKIVLKYCKTEKKYKTVLFFGYRWEADGFKTIYTFYFLINNLSTGINIDDKIQMMFCR